MLGLSTIVLLLFVLWVCHEEDEEDAVSIVDIMLMEEK